MKPHDFIDTHKAHFPVTLLCKGLGVSRSGYYAAKKRKPSKRSLHHALLRVHIRTLFSQNKKRYGHRRITRALKEEKAIKVGKECVRHLMRKEGLKGLQTKRHVRTTVSSNDATFAPNLLEQHFVADAPNQVWAGDITYIPTATGWLFLAVLLDVYSRRVIGWATSTSLHTDVALRALNQALVMRQPDAGFVHHTDRGCQYTSHLYQQRLREAGAVCSMSRKGNCYDNAVSESFFATLKRELNVDVFASQESAHRAVAQHIEHYYNPIRMHSTLDYQSPIAFEQQNQEQTKQAA